MSRALRIAVVCLFLAPLELGCSQWVQQKSTDMSLLKPATASEHSVTLEILFVRVRHGQAEINGAVWQEIDEQRLPNALRREMTANGFRAGQIGGHIPQALADLLNLTDELPAEENQVQEVRLDSEPRLRRRLLQLRTGRRGEILCSSVYKELPLLMRDEGQVSGHTYRDAQGLLAVNTTLRKDGRVRLLLTPEIHHGQARQRWAGQEGMLRFQMARPREVLEQLRIESVLAPGEILVLTCLPDRAGSLGHYFFSEEGVEGPEQKVLMVRLVQMPVGELYQEDEPFIQTAP